MAEHEKEKDRHQELDGFLDTSEIEHRQSNHEDDGCSETKLIELEDAEKCVDACRDRDGNGEDVIDHEGRARSQTGPFAKEFGGDDVAAAARREELDDLVVARGNDEDRDRRGESEIDGQVRIFPSQGTIGFFWPIGRRGEAVGPKASPSQKGHKGQLVENVLT